MMRRIKIIILLLCFALSGGALSGTRYSGEFDYRNFKPSTKFFSGRTASEIAHLCATSEHASTEDLEQCSHMKFERADKKLREELATIASQLKKADLEAKSEDEPQALPYFSRSQTAWVNYRDNYCYGYVYALGPASTRYINFWECMAATTGSRVEQLAHFND
jgi:uncharacterized protein YecT (DUF1311 family)